MFVSQRVTAIAVPAVLVLALGGCSVLQPSGTDEPLTGIAACALGHTWEQDLGALGTSLTEQLTKLGVTPTSLVVEGTQRMEWDIKSHMTIDSDYTVTLTTTPAEGQLITQVDTHSGKITGAAYINSDVAIPRKWDSKLSITSTADNTGAALDPVPYGIPASDFDDSVGLILTCDGDTMTIHPRGSKLTQTWTKVG